MKRVPPFPFSDLEGGLIWVFYISLISCVALVAHFILKYSFWITFLSLLASLFLPVNILICKLGIRRIKKAAQRWKVHTREVCYALEFGLHYNKDFWRLDRDEFLRRLGESQAKKEAWYARARKFSRIKILRAPETTIREENNDK